MLMYEYEIRSKVQAAKQALKALDSMIRSMMSSGDQLPMSQVEYDALFPMASTVKDICQELVNALPPEVVAGNRIVEHCGWIEYWIGKHDKSWAASNISDAQFDLKGLDSSFAQWCGSAAHFDTELRAAVHILLCQREPDSAVRKSFVILKERLVDACCTLGATKSSVAELDGEALVNKLFGNGGFAAPRMVERSSEREALRSLLSGLYGIFRNAVDHHDVEVPWHEAEAVIGMINWALLRLSAMSAEWAAPFEPTAE